jgi:hypothetical protein
MPEKKTPAALPGPKTEAPKQLTIADQVEKELTELTEGNFYMIPGRNGSQRREPDARALQFYANKRGGFCSKILDSGMDEQKAWALLQMWPQDKPQMVKEDKVTIVYAIEFQNLVWDRVDKGCERHKVGCPLAKDEKGQLIFQDQTPVLSDPLCQLGLRRQLNRKMKFAERECVTKAEARLHKKFLSFEWRDEEEIINEAAEIAAVAAGNKTQALPAASTQPAPATPPDVKKEAAKEAEKLTEEAPAPRIDLPKAIIPSEEEMRKRAQGQPAKPAEVPKANGGAAAAPPPKKRSERMGELCEKIGCSQTNMLAFIAASLGVLDPKEIKDKCKTEDIDAVIHGLEHCTKEFGPKIMGPFIRKEMQAGEEHEKIGKAFLAAYSQALKKSGGN